jgi:molecular chaperone GrpE (heat shock protein)
MSNPGQKFFIPIKFMTFHDSLTGVYNRHYLAELQKWAGIQFDPYLVDVFTQLPSKNHKKDVDRPG